MFSYIYSLRLVAKKQCGITMDTLKDADSFELAFRKMIKWIKNIVHKANKISQSGKSAKEIFFIVN